MRFVWFWLAWGFKLLIFLLFLLLGHHLLTVSAMIVSKCKMAKTERITYFMGAVDNFSVFNREGGGGGGGGGGRGVLRVM